MLERVKNIHNQFNFEINTPEKNSPPLADLGPRHDARAARVEAGARGGRGGGGGGSI